jgi:hypothetical protein
MGSGQSLQYTLANWETVSGRFGGCLTEPGMTGSLVRRFRHSKTLLVGEIWTDSNRFQHMYGFAPNSGGELSLINAERPPLETYFPIRSAFLDDGRAEGVA